MSGRVQRPRVRPTGLLATAACLVAGVLLGVLPSTAGTGIPHRSSERLTWERAAPDGPVWGARALDDPRYAGVDWAAIDQAPVLRPDLRDIYTDTPAIYHTACPVGRNEPDFQACTFGARGGGRTVVLVGDSKALQWFTPLRRIARHSGWRLVAIAKVGCPFADVVRPVDGVRNRTCERWGRRALREIVRLRPDAVVTVTRWGTALPPGASASDPLTGAAMVDGLVRYWRAVARTGAVVVPISEIRAVRMLQDAGLAPRIRHRSTVAS